MANEELNLSEILQIRRDKLESLKEMNQNPFLIEKYDQTHHSQDIKDNFEAMEGKDVSIAGRLMSFRDMGKASFCDVQDRQGKIQTYVKNDEIGEEAYKVFKTFDIGDVVGIKGFVFRTKKGEISVHAKEVTLLCKSLQPLPEKFHGLKDPDLRYRQRYLDLIMNPEVKDTFIKRSKIIRSIRKYLDDRDFIECDTPILDPIAGGANARPFITHHNTLDIDMYLRIATELHLKRLIVGGLEKVYEMGRIFRNEGMSVKHNPEFTTIELYEAYTDYHHMMELTENLIAYVAQEVLGTTQITYQGTDIDLTPPWKRISMMDAIKEYAEVDFSQVETDEQARAIAEKLNVHVKPGASKGDIITEVFDEYVEKHLIQPVFITNHPVEVSPLAKRTPTNSAITQRFEGYIYGREICNAFSELNDPIDQKERFLDQARQKEAGNDEAHMMDYDFINALEVGMPPTGGLGIGIDRLIMFLTDSFSIRDVLLFPTMKPLAEEQR